MRERWCRRNSETGTGVSRVFVLLHVISTSDHADGDGDGDVKLLSSAGTLHTLERVKPPLILRDGVLE